MTQEDIKAQIERFRHQHAEMLECLICHAIEKGADWRRLEILSYPDFQNPGTARWVMRVREIPTGQEPKP